jgi:hypothetical protein
MEAPLEIRYAGVVIGRAQEVPNAEGDALSFFIPVRDPMPVGTVLRVRSGEQETPVRVVRAIESADSTVCGMQVRTIGEAEEVARDFIPPPAAAVEKLKPATPTPVVEADLSRMRAESAPAEAANTDSSPTPIASAAPAAEVAPEAAPEVAPEAKAVEAAPAEPASAAIEAAAVPDAVPVTVGSSMTGALKNATESVPISKSAKKAATVLSSKASEPASPQVTMTSAASLTQEYGSVVESASEATDISAAVAGGQPSGEDLPPARPIAGPSGRRKTRRRK